MSYKLILIFVLTVPSSTFDRFCVGVAPAVQYFLCRGEVVRNCDDLHFFVLSLLALCCTGQVFFIIMRCTSLCCVMFTSTVYVCYVALYIYIYICIHMHVYITGTVLHWL